MEVGVSGYGAVGGNLDNAAIARRASWTGALWSLPVPNPLVSDKWLRLCFPAGYQLMLFRCFRSAIVLVAFFTAQAGVLVSPDNSWRFLKGLTEASAPDPSTWRSLSFDDSSWALSQAPFYYENSPGNPTEYTGNTDLTDMYGGYTCIFMRQTFAVTDPQAVGALELDAESDDGFIAWINGVEVARFNMPVGDIPFDGVASGALDEPVPVQTNLVSNPGAILISGTNVLAIQAFNSSLSGSSDFLIWAQLSSQVDETPPTVTDLIPAPGQVVQALTQIEVGFSEDVTGVDASDLLINNQPATRLTAVTSSRYIFEFPQPATGQVQVAWAPNNGITDLAASPNAFAGGNWSYNLDPQARPPGVMISEFMADNHKTLHDEDGASSDWIELLNAGATSVNLEGWFLTDDSANLTLWRFPRVSLLPGTYMIVFASQKDRTNPAAPLHTSFKLAKEGGYLALVDPATNVVSAFAPYLAQYTDVSYGRDRSDPTLLAYFPTPTPGAPNTTGGPGFAPQVSFSIPGGTFRTPFALTLITSDTNAVIHYTLDRTAPTASSPTYTNSLQISNTVEVRAASFVPGLLPGPPHSETYLALAGNTLSWSSDLPVVVIHNFGQRSIPVSTRQFASLSVFEPGLGRTSLTNQPTFMTRAGINIRGSSTQGQAKSNLRVEFWDEFDDPQNAPFLGLPSDNDWILYAPDNYEPVLIHNPFMHELSRRIGRYSSRTRLVEVFLNTAGGPIASGNYFGVYVLEEKIKISKDRVDIDHLEPENNTPPADTGGYLMSIDRYIPGEGQIYAAWQGINALDPKWDDLQLPQRADQWGYINDYLNQFGNALYGPDYLNPTTGYRAYVDVDAWIDHHILNTLAFNVDALRLSAYFYKPREGKLTFGPLWDFDRSLDSTDGRDSNPRVWQSRVPDFGTDMFHYPWWDQMFTDPDFWQSWIDRWQQLRTNQFALTNLWGLVDNLTGQLREAERREIVKWPGFTTPRGGSYQGEINFMKNWLSNRVNFIDTNFLTAPVMSLAGGVVPQGTTVSLSAPVGASIYYTLDGSDPRLSGGSVAPTAQLYNSPIAIQANAHLVARAWDSAHKNLTGTSSNPTLSSPWSGPVEGTFVVATPGLVITEIMYHPGPAPIGSTNTPGDFEFIELQNVTTHALDLFGFGFVGGISYTFGNTSAVTTLAPGAFVVLVKNSAAFASRYPGVTNVAGEYSGSLNNGGERLTLVGSVGEPILDFAYSNNWYPATDGAGFSLVTVDPSIPLSQWGDPAGWRVSAALNGSPGTADPQPPRIPTVLINEVLAHTQPSEPDAVELFNRAADPALIGGWFLTDDPQQPRKFRVPDSVSIPGQGFLVFTAKEFDAGGPGSFGLSAQGDQIQLFSGDGTNLTGFSHHFSFGASPQDATFGRYVTSEGKEHFVLQVRRSLGNPNAGPQVGPVVINEIMYRPAPPATNRAAQYIELRNISSTPVALYDTDHPTNVWHLRGAVDFDFPTNLTLAADEYVLLVMFDPLVELANLQAFERLYGTPTNALILGPVQGSLDQSGQPLHLLRPDVPEGTGDPHPGLVAYILVDEVSYSDPPPWPSEASGTGKSLQRLASNSFGDDPINWWGADPTAGGPNPLNDPKDTDGDGLPDQWELIYGLSPTDATGVNGADGDPDGDGLTNLQEYQAGTDPMDPGNHLRLALTSIGGGVITLQFNATANHSYSVEYLDGLGQTTWAKLTDVPAVQADQTVTVQDTDGPSRRVRFYRVVVP